MDTKPTLEISKGENFESRGGEGQMRVRTKTAFAADTIGFSTGLVCQTAFFERTLKCCSRALDLAAESTERIGICANRTHRKTQLPER